MMTLSKISKDSFPILFDCLKRQVFAAPGFVIVLISIGIVASDVFYREAAWAAWLGISLVFASIVVRGIYAIFFMPEETEVLNIENTASRSKDLLKWYFAFTFSAAAGFGLLGYAVFTSYPFESYPSFLMHLIFTGTVAVSASIASVHLPSYALFLTMIMGFPIYHAFASAHPGLGSLLVLFNGYIFVFAKQHQKYHQMILINHAQGKARSEYYKNIIDSVPGLVAIVDRSLKYRMVNSHVRTYLGMPEDRILGKPIGFLKNKTFSNFVEAFYGSTREYEQVQTKLSKPGQPERWYLVVLHKITKNECMIVSLDIHDRVVAEERNLEQRAVVEASARMAAIGQVTAGIAHEINNPLAVIIGKTQLLKKRWQKLNQEQVEEELKKIELTCFRISKIIKGLRSLSRDGENDQFSETEIKTIYSDVSTILEEKFAQNNIQVETTIPEGLTLECRSVQIGQVLLNLLSNSMDAIKDLPERWIRVEALDLGNFIEISVIDSGTGISEEIAKKLMTPFFTTKTAGHGTGLGLSISRRILKDHHGELVLDKQSPNTRFVLNLPKKQRISKAA